MPVLVLNNITSFLIPSSAQALGHEAYGKLRFLIIGHKL